MATRDPCRTPRKPFRAWPRRFWGSRPQCSRILFKRELPNKRLYTYNSHQTRYWRNLNRFPFSPNRRWNNSNSRKQCRSWYKQCNSMCSMYLYRDRHSLRHFKILCKHNIMYLSLKCLRCGGRYLI